MLISLGAASASDINNTVDDQVLSATPQVDTLSFSVNNGDQDNNTLSVSENNLLSAGSDSGSNELLGTDDSKSSFTSLFDLIRMSHDPIITLYDDYEFKNDESDNQYINGITLSVNGLTIDGGYHTIDGKNMSNLFSTINGDNITIKNLNLKDINGRLTWNGNNGVFDHITSINSNTFYVYGDNMNITHSTFKDKSISAATSYFYFGGLNPYVFDNTFENLQLTVTGQLDEHCFFMIRNSAKNTRIINNTFYKCKSNANVNYGGFFSMVGLTYFEGNHVINCTSGRTFLNLGMPNTQLKNNDFSNITAMNFFYAETNRITFDHCNFNNLTTTYSLMASAVLGSNCVFDFCEFNNIQSNGNGFYFPSAGLVINNTKFSKINNPILVNGFFSQILNSNFTECANNTLTINGNRTTINNCIFSDGVDVDIKITDYENVNIDEGTKDTAKIIGIYNSFTSLLKVWVDNHTNGNGSNDTPANLEYALSIIDYGGEIILLNGVYDISKKLDTIANIIGESRDGVILNHTSFSVKNPINIQNITFINTSDVIESSMGFGVINCSFYTPITNNLFKITSKAMTYKDIRVENATIDNFYNPGGAGGRIDGSVFDNITFYNVTLNSHFVVSGGVPGVEYKHLTFNKTNIKGDLISGYGGGSRKIIEDLHYVDSNISSIRLGGSTVNGLTIENCNLTSSDNYLFLLGAWGYGNGNNILDDIHISNVKRLENGVLTDNFNVFTMNRDGNKITNLYLDDFDFQYLVNSDKAFGLSSVFVNNVNMTSVFQQISVNDIQNYHFNNVNFTSNVSITLADNGVLSNSSFTDYKGHILVTGDNVRFIDSIFVNGNNSDLNGSAILVDAMSTSFNDCIFKGNNASNGTVYFVKGKNRYSFVNTTFTDNLARDVAGALYFQYDEGSGTLVTFDSITEDSINPDPATHRFNGIYGNLTSLATKVYVVNDTSTWSGQGTARTREDAGPLSIAYSIAGVGCEFIFVREGDVFTETITGGILNTIEDGWIFKGNNTTITNLRFNITYPCEVYNITFKDNSKTAVSVESENVTFVDCSFVGNGGDNVDYGGAIQILANNTEIINCTFENNRVNSLESGYGGAIYINASFVNITGSTFKENSANGYGSNIFLENGLSNIRISDNVFNCSSGSSGVTLQGYYIYVIGNNFTNSISAKDGAGLSVIGGVSNLFIQDNYFIKNTVNSNLKSGALYTSFTNPFKQLINISSNYFINNNAGSGGAWYMDNDIFGLVIDGNEFYNNSAVNGGAVYINKDGVNINNGLFFNNSAVNGGAVYINGPGVVLRNITFEENNASLGGALYVNGDNAWVYDSRFIANTANSTNDDRGSAIYIGSGVNFHMRDGILDKNYVFGGNDTKMYYGDISFVDISPDVMGTVFTRDPYQQYIGNNSAFKYAFAFITSGVSKGFGFNAETATTLETVLNSGFTDNLILYIVDRDYMLTSELVNKLSNMNVTVVGVNNTSIKRTNDNNNKYLFNQPKNAKNKKKLCKNISFQLIIYPPI